METLKAHIVQIRVNFDALYQRLNGMPLHEADQVIFPICTLCRNHNQVGFVEGIRIVVLLAQEMDR